MTDSEFFASVCTKKNEYKPTNGYWENLSEAELQDEKKMDKKFKKIFDEAKTNKEKLTELALVLVSKYEFLILAEDVDADDEEVNDDGEKYIALNITSDNVTKYKDRYYDYYSKVDSWACENLEAGELVYYMRMNASL